MSSRGMPLSKMRQASRALVGGEEMDDRVAADLFLPVEGNADVDRQRALLGEQAGRLEDQVGVALVVDGPARRAVRISGSNGSDSQRSSGAGGCTSKCP